MSRFLPRTVLVWVLSGLLYGQNPVTPQYPAAVATSKQLPPATNLCATTLNAPLSAIQTTLSVVSSSCFLVNSILTVDGYNSSGSAINGEKIQISAITGNSVTVYSRGGFGTSPASHNTGAPVEIRTDAYQINSVSAEINGIENFLGIRGNSLLTSPNILAPWTGTKDSIHCMAGDGTMQTCGAGATSGMTQLTGDVTAGPGSGSQATTLATVNSGSGSCGDATHVCAITTNAKGLVTAQTPVLVSGGAGGSGTVTSVGLQGTANQITVTGFSPITTSGTWTLSLPSNLVLPNGTVATTQTQGDASINVATTAYVDNGLSGKAPSSSSTTVNTVACPLNGTCTVADNTKEPVLGNPATSGFVLTSTTGGVRSWAPNGSGTGITQLTGDVAAGPGSGSQSATLATVNSGFGVCGDGGHVCQVTTNAKGLVTSQSALAITASANPFNCSGSTVSSNTLTVPSACCVTPYAGATPVCAGANTSVTRVSGDGYLNACFDATSGANFFAYASTASATVGAGMSGVTLAQPVCLPPAVQIARVQFVSGVAQPVVDYTRNSNQQNTVYSGAGVAVANSSAGQTVTVNVILATCTIGSMPTAVIGQECYAQNAANITDCSAGGGTTKTVCLFNGTSWVRP